MLASCAFWDVELVQNVERLQHGVVPRLDQIRLDGLAESHGPDEA